MNFLPKILTILFVASLASNVVFGQKEADKSRLNIGQSPKKTSIAVSNSSILSKGNLPQTINFSTKNNYTQFYRDLIISNKSKNTEVKSVLNQGQESNSEKIRLSNIYPNPANDFAYIDISVNSNFNSANISFFNLLGKQVADFELNKYSEKLKINTSNWESGIYGYQLVVDGKKVATKKLLVRHN